ncbi:unnamed protein product [Peronospora destructor]|uniref:FYVE zinc finger domain-containing protein n=1 Tax=Peronospora destructor TaxID=86335 RepID=A0AAV0UZM3_9STRA|nr:unnamed protein product [Peronospora destructor]
MQPLRRLHKKFWDFLPQHHCRMCGEVVCNKCTLYKDAMIPGTFILPHGCGELFGPARQWFEASARLARKTIPRKIAFCAYTVHTREPMVVLDTLQDPRFRNNPLVSNAADLQFDDNNADESKRHQDNGRGVIVENAAQNKRHNFDKAKIGVPISPATSASTSSMSWVASATSSAQASLPSITLDNNDGDGSQDEDTSVAITQLPMEPPAAGEQTEVLHMQLLTQHNVAQQRLAVQQTLLSTKLGQHADQISKLMSAFTRMKAKAKSKVDGRTK